jgi:uncharacterized membrane protein YhaH (DUF805 family)
MEQPSSPADAPPAARRERLTLDELTAIALGADPRRPTLAQLYLGTKGRIPRRTYWLNGVLALFALSIVVNGLLEIARVSDDVAVWLVIGLFAWPFIAVMTKRLHDFGASAWWLPPGLLGIGLLLMLAFGFSAWWLLGNFVGIWFLGMLVAGLVPSAHGANRFGADPRPAARAVNSGH